MVHTNMDTGEIIKAKYTKYIRLEKNAVPSIFPKDPQSLTKQSTSRSCNSPKTFAVKNEMHHVPDAIKESLELAQKSNEKDKVKNFSDLLEKINSVDTHKFWSYKEMEKELVFYHINNCPNSQIVISVSISENLDFEVFCRNLNVTNDMKKVYLLKKFIKYQILIIY